MTALPCQTSCAEQCVAEVHPEQEIAHISDSMYYSGLKFSDDNVEMFVLHVVEMFVLHVCKVGFLLVSKMEKL